MSLNDQAEAMIDSIQAFSRIELAAFPVSEECAWKFCRAAYGRGYQDALHGDLEPASVEAASVFVVETWARLPVDTGTR